MIKNRQPETVSRPYRDWFNYFFLVLTNFTFVKLIKKAYFGQTEIEPNLKHQILGFYIDFEIEFFILLIIMSHNKKKTYFYTKYHPLKLADFVNSEALYIRFVVPFFHFFTYANDSSSSLRLCNQKTF